METFEVGKTYERYVRKVYRRPVNPQLRSFDCGKRVFGLSRALLLGCRPQVLEKGDDENSKITLFENSNMAEIDSKIAENSKMQARTVRFKWLYTFPIFSF